MSAPPETLRTAAEAGRLARRLRHQVGQPICSNLQRQAVRRQLAEWERAQPGRCENIFRALAHVSPSHLADRQLFDFAALATHAAPA